MGRCADRVEGGADVGGDLLDWALALTTQCAFQTLVVAVLIVRAPTPSLSAVGSRQKACRG